MLSNIGPGMLILIIIVALLLFGPSKLPELGRAFGRTLKEFKNGARDIMSDEESSQAQARKEVGPSTQAPNPAPADPQRYEAPRYEEPRSDSAGSSAAAPADANKPGSDNRRLPE